MKLNQRRQFARVALFSLMALGAGTAFAQALIGPDLNVTKVCVVTAPQSVLCTVTIKNTGQVPSVSPLSLTDTPTAPPGSTYTGAGSNTGLPIGCSLGAGPVLPIPCTANKSLQPGESADALFSFKVPQGGTFRNCVTVSQGSNAATLPDPNLANNTNICTKIDTQPGGGKIAVIKQIVNNNAGIPTPGPFVIQVNCSPNGPNTTVSLTSQSLSQILNVSAGSICKIEEVPPKAPDGCKWITTYPNGQTGKAGDKLVVQNELKCESTCPTGQAEMTFPGTDVKYCCEGKPGSDKFCCNKKK